MLWFKLLVYANGLIKVVSLECEWRQLRLCMTVRTEGRSCSGSRLLLRVVGKLL